MAYAYPQPPSGQAGEAEGPYRAQASSTSLPPFREIDSRTQPHHSPAQQAAGQPAMGSPLPSTMSQYYQGQAQSLPPPLAHMNVTADPNQPARYPIPAADGRMMSGGRHKKEIKRRTKTGCLTCRRRRIKCDEAHPTCRNCTKSKRDCLGYDPIFKAQPGPAAIQPAPSAAPPLQSTAATASPYLQAPQGYMAASGQPFAPGLAAGAGSPGSSNEYDYSGAIDPQLQGEGAGHLQAPSSLYDGLHEGRLGAKPTKVEDIMDVPGFPCPAVPPGPVPPQMMQEIKNVYTTIYAPTLDKFLETHWYATRGLQHLLANTRLCELFASLISRYNITAQSNWGGNQVNQSIETRVLWGMLQLAQPVSAAAAANPADSNNTFEISEGVHDAAKRMEVFEALVTNQYLDSDPLHNAGPPPGGLRNGTKIDEQIKSHGRDFWHQVALFLTLRDDEASSAKDIDECLITLRNLLDSKENRDVMYSIAVARHLGQRMADEEKLLSASKEETETEPSPDQEQRALLKVARNFIQEEAKGNGTTQVVQRLCGMAQRSWGGMR